MRRALTGLAMRIALVLAVVVGITSCATTEGTPSVSPAGSVVSPSPSDLVDGSLEGRWATGPVTIADIKASMVEQGLTPSEVEAWVKETGSPSQFAFELDFSDESFTHSQETPQSEMQVDESGTFTYAKDRLILSIGEAGNLDTYTFAVRASSDELTLKYVESTEEGTAEDKAKHRRYTLAFYCSSTFKRRQ